MGVGGDSFPIRRWLRHSHLYGGVLLLLPFALFIIAPSAFTPYDPLKTSVMQRLQPPSAEHRFGTDELGRDVFARVVYGARISLPSAFITIVFAAVVGVFAGVTAGYFGGRLDRAIMIVADMVLSFPRIPLAMLVASALGPGIRNAMLSVGIVWWPLYARLVRGLTLRLKQEEYVEAARAIGAGSFHIVRRHILPGAFSSINVRFTLDLGFSVLILASLGFVGLGASAPAPEWGTTVSVSRVYFLTEWWIGFFPGVAITLVVIGTTLLGDALNDLLNPLV